MPPSQEDGLCDNFVLEGVCEMKEYQNLIGKVILAVAIILGAMIIGNAILEASGNIGSQIASALNTIASQIQ